MDPKSKILDGVKQGLLDFAQNAGDQAVAAAKDLEEFYRSVEPNVEQLVIEALAGDPIAPEGLKLLADAAASRSGFGSEYIAERAKELNNLFIGLVKGALAATAALA